MMAILLAVLITLTTYSDPACTIPCRDFESHSNVYVKAEPANGWYDFRYYDGTGKLVYMHDFQADDKKIITWITPSVLIAQSSATPGLWRVELWRGKEGNPARMVATAWFYVADPVLADGEQ